MSALKVDKAFVLDKCRSFREFQLWPLSRTVNPVGWLNNFKTEEEIKHACHLLNAFMFYSENFVDEIFTSAFHSISNSVDFSNLPAVDRRREWKQFCNNVVFTYVTGETPNPSDSGYLFARKARQLLGIPEHRLLHPGQALMHVINNKNAYVVFVDDFVGSGNQFVTTWLRQYQMGRGMPISFDTLSKSGFGRGFYYNAAICTSIGLDNISKFCMNVKVFPGNVIGPEYSAINSDSYVWPEGLKKTGPKFVKDVSSRLGIPDTNGGEDDWRGFHKLALCLAFSHSTPDATLPIFYWEQGDWIPMVRRR